MLSSKEKKDCETDNETESDSDDSIFSGLDTECLRSNIKKMTHGFSVQAEQERKEELEKIRKAFQVSCNVTDLTDKEAK